VPGGGTVTVVGKGPFPGGIKQSALDAAGAFEVDGVRPGPYDVYVKAVPPPFVLLTHRDGRPVGAPPVVPDFEFGSASVVVARTPVAVAIRTGPGATLRGTLVIDGDRTGVSPDLFQLLQATTTDPLASRPGSMIGSDWSFEIENLSVPTRIVLLALAQGWFLKSFIVNGIDAAEDPVDFSNGRNASDNVRAVIGRVPRVTGRAVDVAGVPAPNHMILLFPVEHERRHVQSRYVRTVRTGDDGSYAVYVPPGQYWIGALDAPPMTMPTEEMMAYLQPLSIFLTVPAVPGAPEMNAPQDVRVAPALR